MSPYANAISSIESGGRYDLLGPVTRTGDRAYGKYQVMGNNVGPWSRSVLGQELTPQQFLSNPQAQDAVFQAKFGEYVNRHGPTGAAKAWFAGEGGMHDPNRKDILGTSVADYARKFNAASGGGLLGAQTGQPATQASGLLGNLTSGAPTGQGSQGLGQLAMSMMGSQPPPMMQAPPPFRPRIDLGGLQALLQRG